MYLSSCLSALSTGRTLPPQPLVRLKGDGTIIGMDPASGQSRTTRSCLIWSHYSAMPGHWKSTCTTGSSLWDQLGQAGLIVSPCVYSRYLEQVALPTSQVLLPRQRHMKLIHGTSRRKVSQKVPEWSVCFRRHSEFRRQRRRNSLPLILYKFLKRNIHRLHCPIRRRMWAPDNILSTRGPISVFCNNKNNGNVRILLCNIMSNVVTVNPN